MATPPASTATTSSSGERKTSEKAQSTAIAMHVGEDRQEEAVSSTVPLQVSEPGGSGRDYLRRSPSFSGMQRGGSPNAGGGVPDLESLPRSLSLLPSPAEGSVGEKEKESENSGAGERGLLLSCSDVGRRSPSFGKEAENESSLLALSDLSENACEMATRRLRGFDWAALTEKDLGSMEVHPNSQEGEVDEKRKRKLDFCQNSNLSEISQASNKGRKCMEEKPSVNSADVGRLDQFCLLPCLNGIENGNGNSNAPSSVEERHPTEDDISLSGRSRAKNSEEKILRRSPRSLSAATKPKKKEQRIKNGSRTYVSYGANENEDRELLMEEEQVEEYKLVMEEKKILRRSPRSFSAVTKPKKKEQPIKNCSRTCVSYGAKENEDRELVMEEEQVEEYKRCYFIGEPVPDAEARQRWPWRYEMENRRVKRRSLTVNDDEEDELILNVDCHYAQAQINDCDFELGDCAYMRGENGDKHIGRIVEFFRTIDQEDYCRVQWFYKAEDTVMKGQTSFHDKKRVFYSTIMNDNLLDCVISKLKIIQVTHKLNSKPHHSPPCDYYYDMEYCLDYSTFCAMPTERHDLSSPSCNSATVPNSSTGLSEDIQICELYKRELSLLDLYSGCGAMSTGLCLGAKMSGVDLVTRWAVDFDSDACESLIINHPKTQVRHGTAENFLELLKQWEKLCKKFIPEGSKRQLPTRKSAVKDNIDDSFVSDDEFEVEELLDICYGDPDNSGKKGLKFKVHWKGYDSDEDTWEPIEGLRNCQEHMHDFVTNGFKTKILPLPGDVDIICGGPPCQGISGYNRFRSIDDPFDDDRNRQLLIFMDIVKFLKPKYVLMENVVDILKFDKGSLGRYALSRLVHMNYQARVGIMAAGCYGLPQFRLRVFFWGAHPNEDLPQFPLPSHDVILRYWPPPEFERNVVAYDEGQSHNLQAAVVLRDALSDLPAVGNDARRDKMPYEKLPETDFQVYIRSIKCDMRSGTASVKKKDLLYDHLPLRLNEDDYIRVCHVPRRKGANFRDLPGIVVGYDNVVERDLTCDNAILPSGKPMVPDYALTFEQGKSKRPFGRLWWDETVPTIVTFPTCHSQVILHPEQDRVLTVRECARIQGFPDHYRFSGTVKKRYRQIGNAVSIPVAKALGYALGMACQKQIGKGPLLELPPNFAYSHSL